MFFCTMLSIIYGIGHDFVTANVAVEYFTVYHKFMVASDSPVVMALIWGIVNTYWLGTIAGILLVLANSLGKWPRVPYSSLMRWAINGTVMQWLCAMLILAYALKNPSLIPGSLLDMMDGNQKLGAVLLTHNWSYLSSILLVITLVTLTAMNRSKLRHVKV